MDEVPSIIDLYQRNGIDVASDKTLLANIRMQPAQSDPRQYNSSLNVVSGKKNKRFNPNSTFGAASWINAHNGYEVPVIFNADSKLSEVISHTITSFNPSFPSSSSSSGSSSSSSSSSR